MQHEAGSVIQLRILDVDSSSDYLDIELEVESHGIAIRPGGYGIKVAPDGDGAPLLIEFRNGIPMIVIWNDINNEEPSHVISLEKSAESNRCRET